MMNGICRGVCAVAEAGALVGDAAGACAAAISAGHSAKSQGLAMVLSCVGGPPRDLRCVGSAALCAASGQLRAARALMVVMVVMARRLPGWTRRGLLGWW